MFATEYSIVVVSLYGLYDKLQRNSFVHQYTYQHSKRNVNKHAIDMIGSVNYNLARKCNDSILVHYSVMFILPLPAKIYFRK